MPTQSFSFTPNSSAFSYGTSGTGTYNTNYIPVDFQGQYSSTGPYYIATTAGQKLQLYLPNQVVNNAGLSSTLSSSTTASAEPSNVFGDLNLVYALATYTAPQSVAYVGGGFPVFTGSIPPNTGSTGLTTQVSAISSLDSSFTNGNTSTPCGWSITSTCSDNCVLSCFFQVFSPSGTYTWPTYLSQWGVGNAGCGTDNDPTTSPSTGQPTLLNNQNVFQFSNIGSSLGMYRQTGSQPSSQDPLVFTLLSTWIPIPYVGNVNGQSTWLYGFIDLYMYSPFQYSYMHANVYQHTPPCYPIAGNSGYAGYIYMYYSSNQVAANSTNAPTALAIPGADRNSQSPSTNTVFPFCMDPNIYNTAFGNGSNDGGFPSVQYWTNNSATNTPSTMTSGSNVYHFNGVIPVLWWYVQTVLLPSGSKSTDNSSNSFATMAATKIANVSTGLMMLGSINQPNNIKPASQSIPYLFNGFPGASTNLATYNIFSQFAPYAYYS